MGNYILYFIVHIQYTKTLRFSIKDSTWVYVTNKLLGINPISGFPDFGKLHFQTFIYVVLYKPYILFDSFNVLCHLIMCE